MRISDWSSDVCSSDLVGDHREPEVEDPDGFRGIGDIGVPSILRAPLDRELLGIVAGEVVFLVLGFLEAAAAAEEMLSPFRDVDLVDPRLLLRSEEHTSELQSLMRISYAVFCLKKKNKK